MYWYILDGNDEPMKLEGSYIETSIAYAMWRRGRSPHIFDDTVDGIRVSTVFLGLDHGWQGSPILFETMVFGGKHDEYCQRYCNRMQAKAGHDQALSMVRESLYGLPSPDLEFINGEGEEENE